MTIEKSQWDYEEKRLTTVLDEIKDQLKQRRSAEELQKSAITGEEKFAWDKLPHLIRSMDDIIELSQHSQELERMKGRHEMNKDVIARLEKMAPFPYFGRIDFLEIGEPTLSKIYIGHFSLVNEKTGEHLIYDWRAPISSLFYDFELGPASYLSKDGLIEGEIKLKRQYKILNGKLEYIFDSTIKIDDLMLQKILSQTKDGKMKDIVKSIQREQNKVIRDDEHKLLIVQGPAGSGKTSIALHRIAYLLYKYRDTLSSDEIIIFSPNEIFADYISNVLPKLGENNVRESTFQEYAENVLGYPGKVESWAEQMEYILSCQNEPEYETRLKSIRYKASRDYLQLLKEYANYLQTRGFPFRDLIYQGKLIVSKDEISRLFNEDYAWLPLKKRLDKIQRRLVFLLDHIKNERTKEIEKEIAGSPEHVFASKMEIRYTSRKKAEQEFKSLMDLIGEMASWDIYRAYSNLFQKGDFLRPTNSISQETLENIRQQTLEDIKNGVLRREDLAPILFLKIILEGEPQFQRIKHVIVDEAQDYSLIEYEVIKGLFQNTKITFLGDLEQSLCPYTRIKYPDQIEEIFHMDDSATITLTKSYRTTHEIFSFSRAIISEKREIDTICRRGERPKVICMPDKESMIKSIIKDMFRLKDQRIESIAVICKSAREAKEVFKRIPKTEAHLVTGEDTTFKSGVVVIPIYLAKGLEFDAVIMYNTSYDAYHNPDEKNLLYTGATRALHHLHLYYYGKISPFLSAIESELFDSRFLA